MSKNTSVGYTQKKSLRVIALSLAAILSLSAVTANPSALVNWFTANAASHDSTDYYEAKLTLYDYVNDNEFYNGGDDNSANDGTNRNNAFNRALINSGYVSRAGEWGSLDYFPLYLGLQYPGVNGMGFDVNDDRYNYSMPVNSEANSGTSGAAQGLVNSELVNGRLVQGESLCPLPYFDEEFLTADPSNYGFTGTYHGTMGNVAKGYKFRFAYNEQSGDEDFGYYEYDSSEMGLNYANKIYTANDSGTKYYDMNGHSGFFPWAYNGVGSGAKYCYGAKFEIGFTMSTSGTLISHVDGQYTDTPIEFRFRGDDDVWVFIDGKLVLDIGGAHGAVAGSINFKDKTAYVEHVKTSTNYNHSANATVGDGSPESIADVLNSIGLFNDPTEEHTLTVFYIERGTIESNCKISFNFQVADTLAVKNTLDTSDVNEYFRDDALAVAEKEGIQYKIASNGGTSTFRSPDADKDLDELFVEPERYTVSFFEADGTPSTAYSKITVSGGTRIVLPAGYKVNVPEGKEFAGWINKSASDDATPYGNTVVVNSNMSLKPKFKKIPVTLELPKAPMLAYVSGINITGSSDGGMPSYQNGNNYLRNYTSSGNDNFDAWWQDSSNNNTQYPVNGSTLLNGATMGDRVAKIKRGYVYIITTNSVDRYPVSDATYGSTISSGVQSWIHDYYDLYTALCEARQNILTLDEAEQNVSSYITEYEAALASYKTMVPESESSTNASELAASLRNDIPSVVYDYSYQYGSEYVNFYIYSTSTPTWELTDLPSRATSLSTSGPCNLVTNPTLPAEPYDTTTYPTSNYYRLTKVPEYVIETKTPQGGGTSVVTHFPISIKLCGVAESEKVVTDIRDMRSGSKQYPCYYNTSYKLWKDITDSDITYSWSDEAIVWFYGDPGSITISGDNISSETVTATADEISGYYYAKVPKSVKKSIDNTTTDASMSFTLNDSSYNDTVNNAFNGRGTTPCYFATNPNNGWHKIVTIVVDTPTWWADSCYLYVQNGTSDPLVCPAWPDTSISMTKLQNNVFAYYIPSGFDVNHVFKDTSGSPTNDSYRGEEITNISADTQYAGSTNGGVGQQVYWPTKTTIGTSNSFYSNTATFKASNATGSYLNPSIGVLSIAEIMAPEAICELDEDVEEDEPNKAEAEDNDVETPETEIEDVDNEALTVSEAAARSGNSVGQYEGTAGTYSAADTTNFQLYSRVIQDAEKDEAQSVIRQTGSDGGFYLLFGQSAKFTYQFNRQTGLKISQMPKSWLYNDVSADNTVVPDSSGNGRQMSTSLYKRYRTTWTLSDDFDDSYSSSMEHYAVYGDKVNQEYSETPYAINYDNIDPSNEANDRIGIYLVATYVNSVVTGDLKIQKQLTDAAANAVENAIAKDSNYDPEFTFTVKFSNVFGGSSTETLYGGSYKLTNGSNTTTETAVDGEIKLKYSEIKAGYYAVIEGIPVDTVYSVTETLPTGGAVKFAVSTLTDCSGTIEATASETGVEGEVGVTSGALAQYYNVEAEDVNVTAIIMNDLNTAYIKITKTVSENYYGPKDDPAGLLSKTIAAGKPLVGGVTGQDAKDPNGYQRATEAKQTFIFKISEYSNSSFTGDPDKVFYETISFDSTPFSTSQAKSRMIQVTPGKYYKVEEVEAWSWKYTLSGTTVGNTSNSVSNKIANLVVFTETVTDDNSNEYSNAASVAFANNKNSTKKDIEGDTTFATNIIRKAS